LQDPGYTDVKTQEMLNRKSLPDVLLLHVLSE
jgi:hypothetical protein